MTAAPGPSRRVVLTGALGIALGACTVDPQPRPGRRTVTAGPTPQLSHDDGDVARVTSAIGDEERLLGYCTSVGARHRATRDLVLPLASRQRAHVRVLRGILTDEVPGPTTVSPAVPGSAEAAFRELDRRLRTARDRRLDDCLAVSSGLLARVMASASASHACSLAELGGGR